MLFDICGNIINKDKYLFIDIFAAVDQQKSSSSCFTHDSINTLNTHHIKLADATTPRKAAWRTPRRSRRVTDNVSTPLHTIKSIKQSFSFFDIKHLNCTVKLLRQTSFLYKTRHIRIVSIAYDIQTPRIKSSTNSNNNVSTNSDNCSSTNSTNDDYNEMQRLKLARVLQNSIGDTLDCTVC